MQRMLFEKEALDFLGPDSQFVVCTMHVPSMRSDRFVVVFLVPLYNDQGPKKHRVLFGKAT
jgi:hypothetical protein